MSREIEAPHDEACVTRTAFLLAIAIALALGVLLAGFAWRSGRAGPDLVLDDRINPNTASLGSLLRLPGVGVQRAQAIVAYRQRAGQQRAGPAFRDPCDLEAVPGLGPATVRAMAPYLRFDSPSPQGASLRGGSEGVEPAG